MVAISRSKVASRVSSKQTPAFKSSLSSFDKRKISSFIRQTTEFTALKDFQKLQQIGNNASTFSPRCRIGNESVDFFTFHHRLETKGKYNVNFYEFLENLEFFKKKKFISNMLDYYSREKNNTNPFKVYKEVYNICISSINIFRPLMAMEVFAKYKPFCVLDPCAGWGGRLIGAMALNVPQYIGIEINSSLSVTYQTMVRFYKTMASNIKTKVTMKFQSCANISYELLDEYDMVFTSPPYYFIEKYPKNVQYESKEEMRVKFYNVFITNSWAYLKRGGHFILNVNQEIYRDCCVSLLGEADEILPLKKSQRQNKYVEYLYVWKKI